MGALGDLGNVDAQSGEFGFSQMIPGNEGGAPIEVHFLERNAHFTFPKFGRGRVQTIGDFPGVQCQQRTWVLVQIEHQHAVVDERMTSQRHHCGSAQSLRWKAL